MRIRLRESARRSVGLALGCLAAAAAVAVGVTVMAGSNETGPVSAPPMAFVGDTSTPTGTGSPPQSGGPTATGAPKPSSSPTSAGPTSEGDCGPLVGYDYGS